MAKVQDRIRGLRGRFSGVRRPSARRFCQWVRGRTTRSPETTAGRYAPRLTKVRYALPCVLLTAGALSWGLYTGLWDLAPRTELHNADGSRYWGVNRLELVKTTITACGFVGAVLAGLYAYRKQKIAENEAHRADADQFAQRYTTAAEQLGHDQAAVRLAGVYALARLADDWTEQRQTCIDVLCAYLRMPYDPAPDSPHYRHGEKQVRLTIITTIRTHLANPHHPHTWCGRDLDFTGTTFDGGDFSGAKFIDGNVDFSGAKFTGGHVDFFGAKFTGGNVHFSNAEFTGGNVHFIGAKFTGGNVDFSDAEFTGTVFFPGPFQALIDEARNPSESDSSE
ncbi:MAG: hypothetical protein QG608_1319 [Actinomycetota bacterium]|nr:hypothetical protein [Actinomycetota bacterium]